MLKNIGWMTVSTVLRMGSGFVVIVSVARSLGAESFGTLSYWMAVAGLATLPVNYGFGLQLLRDVGADETAASRVMTETILAKLLLSIGVFCTALAAPFFVSFPAAVFFLVLAMFVVESFAEHANFLLRARGKFGQEAIASAISSAAAIPIVAGTAFISHNLELVCLAFLGSRVLALLLSFGAARHLWTLRIAAILPALGQVGTVLRRGFSYATDVLLGAVNSTLDSILIGHLLDVRAVGLYQAGMKLFQAFTALAPMVSYVYLPRLAAEGQQGGEVAFAQTTDAMMRKLIVVGSVGAIVLAIAPGALVRLLYGRQYDELGGLLPWFALALMLRFVTATFGVVLTSVGQQVTRASINAVSVLVLVAAIGLLAHLFGVRGVLMALALTAVFTSTAYWIALRRLRIGAGLTVPNVLIAAPALALVIWRIVSS